MERQQWWLVIGDGNFSFSLSLVRANSASIKLITSTLNSRSSDPAVIKNVESLEEMDAVVLFEVDGTQLSKCAYFTERCLSFDVIIFNFPHTGGKSNIKRNRELLRDFFKSAIHFLNTSGEVHVTLCKGQGGTPVDYTKRGYSNSWKIVEMAAYAGLILARVDPFPKGLYPSYVPTGYRGLKKEFSLDGAMRHVLRFPQPDKLHWCVNIQGCYGCQYCGQYACNEVVIPVEFQDAICYPLLCHSWHPIVQVKNMLLDHIKNSSLYRGIWTGCADSPHLLLHQTPSQCIPSCTTSHPKTVHLYCPSCANSELNNHQSVCCDFHTGHCFSPTLELDLPRLVSAITCSGDVTLIPMQLACSPVVQNVDISLGSFAQSVSHELIGVVSLRSDESSEYFEMQFHDLIKDILKNSPRLPDETMPLVLVNDFISGIYVDKWKVLATGDSTNSSIAKMGIHSTKSKRYFTFIVFLEALAMLYYGIDDVRLMRSRDIHFSAQFLKSPVLRYVGFCLHAPRYKHDISFWHTSLNSSLHVVQQKLSSVIKQITGNVVVDMACIDVYNDPGGCGTSYCFQLTYHHYDQSISKSQAGAMQQMIREALSTDSEIKLR